MITDVIYSNKTSTEKKVCNEDEYEALEVKDEGKLQAL